MNSYIRKPVDLDRFLDVLRAIDDYWVVAAAASLEAPQTLGQFAEELRQARRAGVEGTPTVASSPGGSSPARRPSTSTVSAGPLSATFTVTGSSSCRTSAPGIGARALSVRRTSARSNGESTGPPALRLCAVEPPGDANSTPSPTSDASGTPARVSATRAGPGAPVEGDVVCRQCADPGRVQRDRAALLDGRPAVGELVERRGEPRAIDVREEADMAEVHAEHRHTERGGVAQRGEDRAVAA